MEHYELVLHRAPLDVVSHAISATNTLVLGLSPAVASSLLASQTALAASMAALNAVSGQHNQQAINSTACVQGVLALLGRRR